MNRLINYVAIILGIIINVHAMTEAELRAFLSLNYSTGAPKRAGEAFARDHKGISDQLGIQLVVAFRNNSADLPTLLAETLSTINRGRDESQPASFPTTSGTPTSHTHASGASKQRTREETEEEQLSRVLEESRLEHEARKRDAQRADDEARADAVARSRREAEEEKARRRAARQGQENRERVTHWLETTKMIGKRYGFSVAGFPGVSHRLEVFNPLYANNFVGKAGVTPGEEKAFPNVPIVHQYNPRAAANGAFYPLVVKLPDLDHLNLSEHIKDKLKLAAYPTCEIYWTVQNVDSLSAQGEGAGDNIVYRPQYWVQPNGAPIAFSTDAQLMGPDGDHHQLGAVSYSIHDGVASPNAPVIPFHDRLRSGKSTSFWSLVSYGGRTALSLHWIVSQDGDIGVLEGMISRSTTLADLMKNLGHQRGFFSHSAQHMIDEVETILWQNR